MALITEKEAAERTGRDLATIRYWRKKGIIPHFPFKPIMIDEDDLAPYLKTYTDQEAAARIGCTPDKLANWRHLGILPFIPGRIPLIKEHDLLSFIEKEGKGRNLATMETVTETWRWAQNAVLEMSWRR